jgi:hypothetical protein
MEPYDTKELLGTLWRLLSVNHLIKLAVLNDSCMILCQNLTFSLKLLAVSFPACFVWRVFVKQTAVMAMFYGCCSIQIVTPKTGTSKLNDSTVQLMDKLHTNRISA